MIHETAIIHPTAEIGQNVTIGPWTQIGPQVTIGDGTEIESHVVIPCNTILGAHNYLESHAAVGGASQHLGGIKEEDTWLKVGDHNVFRAFCTINRGSLDGGGVTEIGHHNLLMSYVHVAHDCRIGNNVVFVNNASLAGHVEVQDHAIISGFSCVHQFSRIGAYSFLARATQVTRDVPPYVLVVGNPGQPVRINAVGLKRNGFSSDEVRVIRQGFQLLSKSDLSLAEAREAIFSLVDEAPVLQAFLDAIDHRTQRGLLRGVSAKKEDMLEAGVV